MPNKIKCNYREKTIITKSDPDINIKSQHVTV